MARIVLFTSTNSSCHRYEQVYLHNWFGYEPFEEKKPAFNAKRGGFSRQSRFTRRKMRFVTVCICSTGHIVHSKL